MSLSTPAPRYMSCHPADNALPPCEALSLSVQQLTAMFEQIQEESKSCYPQRSQFTSIPTGIQSVTDALSLFISASGSTATASITDVPNPSTELESQLHELTGSIERLLEENLALQSRMVHDEDEAKLSQNNSTAAILNLRNCCKNFEHRIHELTGSIEMLIAENVAFKTRMVQYETEAESCRNSARRAEEAAERVLRALTVS